MKSDNNDLESTLISGKEFRASIWDLLQEVSVIDQKSDAILRFVSIALQHQHSITLLIETGNPSSSFALLRCLNDTCIRGIWVATDATPEQIAAILNGEYKYGNIGKRLEERFGTGLSPQVREFLNSLTHSGYEQLIRQFSKRGMIEPEFEPEVLVACIRSASAVLAALSAQAFAVVDRKDLANEMWEHFKALFNQGDTA
jgi:hypothetical protein